MRLGKIVFVVGVVIIASALIFGNYPLREPITLYDDVSSGFIFSAYSDIHIEVTVNTGGSVFSMYLLDGIDANNTVVQNKSITLATPLAQFENITSFDDTLTLPGLGVYALYFTSPESELLYLSIYVHPLHSNLPLLSGGIVVVSLGLILIVSSWGLKKKRNNEGFPEKK
ncbi:MAG: hypothetical protein E4H14_00445 [Candidatus Thorarchaeota archaeon]|nr:MAG: hypothetical protein E4H14_00445 [Candidatus Thorarchaeota archaeon]